MKKQHLTLGIVLALATTACTGIGVQTGPTLTSQIAEDTQLGYLWNPSEDNPNGIVEPHLRDDVRLSDLWVEGEEQPARTAPEPSPRATNLLERMTLTDPVFASYSNTSQVLPK